MRSILRLTAAACVLVGLSAGRANADITYELRNVNLIFDSLAATGQNAGALTGSFTTNDARTQLISASIFASGATVQLTTGVWIIPPTYFTFTGTEYTTENSSVTAILGIPLLSDSLTFLQPVGSNLLNAEQSLFLNFVGRLNATGETQLQISSFFRSSETQEGIIFDHTRYVTSGSVAAVPEPSAVAVVAICAPALLVYGRRRRETASAA